MAIVVTPGINVKVNQSQFDKHIIMLALATKKKLGEILKTQARLTCKDICDFYPPFSGSAPSVTHGGEGGFGNKARDKGRAAVNRDVRKIFAPLAQAPAGVVAQRGDLGIFDAWIRAKKETPPPHSPSWLFGKFNSGSMGMVWSDGYFDASAGFTTQVLFDRFIQSRHGNFGGEGNIMLNESEGQIGAVHRMVRGPVHYRVGKNRKPDFYVRDWKLVERYIKKTQQRVGKLKAGWYYAGLKLGSMPTSAWIREQGSGNAIFESNLGGSLQTIKVGNAIGKKHTQGWHLIAKARDHRAFAMRNNVIKMLKDKKDGGRKLLEVIQGIEGFKIETT